MGRNHSSHSTTKIKIWTSFAVFTESEDRAYELSYGWSLSDFQ